MRFSLGIRAGSNATVTMKALPKALPQIGLSAQRQGLRAHPDCA
jgi:hypothetical protein